MNANMAVPAPTAAPPDDRWSPELALVCPELRSAAIAALPDLDPEGFVPRRIPVQVEAPEFRLMRAFDIESAAEEPETRVPLPLAILAYTSQRAFVVAVESAAMVGLVIGLLAAAAAIRP